MLLIKKTTPLFTKRRFCKQNLLYHSGMTNLGAGAVNVTRRTYKVVVVRPPLDRLLSAYRYIFEWGRAFASFRGFVRALLDGRLDQMESEHKGAA